MVLNNIYVIDKIILTILVFISIHFYKFLCGMENKFTYPGIHNLSLFVLRLTNYLFFFSFEGLAFHKIAMSVNIVRILLH